MTAKQLDKEIKRFVDAHPEMDLGWFYDIINEIAKSYEKTNKLTKRCNHGDGAICIHCAKIPLI